MPVRSLTSSVLRWPDREAVDRAARAWAVREQARWPALSRLGYFGSYARGDWGVGSDLDVLAIVTDAEAAPFEARAARLDALSLPVPADVLVYTEREWAARLAAGDAFALRVEREAVWLL